MILNALYSVWAINRFYVNLEQVDKSEEDQFSGSQRRGRIYLQKFRRSNEANNQESSGETSATTLDLIQTLETAAILDLKWSPGAD